MESKALGFAICNEEGFVVFTNDCHVIKRSHRFFVICLLSTLLTIPLFSTSRIASVDSILQLWYKPDTTRQAPTEEDAIAFAIDASGNIYVAGWTPGNGAANDFLIAQYTADGVRQWLTRYKRWGSSFNYGRGLGVDNSGNVYVSCPTIGSGFAEYTTNKYSPFVSDVVEGDAKGMPSGTCFYRLTAGGATITRTMVLLR